MCALYSCLQQRSNVCLVLLFPTEVLPVACTLVSNRGLTCGLYCCFQQRSYLWLVLLFATEVLPVVCTLVCNRGLMSIQCLKKMEELSNCKIYELFDFVCGVSTGALIVAMVCLYRLPLDECQRLYVDFSRQMFSRSRVIGTGGLVWNHSFYDSSQWEEILK